MYLSGKPETEEVLDAEEDFLVHFIAFLDFDLEKYLQNLYGHYPFKVVKGAGTDAQSIEIKIKPLALRKLLSELPREVHVSYEMQERPENC